MQSAQVPECRQWLKVRNWPRGPGVQRAEIRCLRGGSKEAHSGLAWWWLLEQRCADDTSTQVQANSRAIQRLQHPVQTWQLLQPRPVGCRLNLHDLPHCCVSQQVHHSGQSRTLVRFHKQLEHAAIKQGRHAARGQPSATLLEGKVPNSWQAADFCNR
jgi:hypothetical protein